MNSKAIHSKRIITPTGILEGFVIIREGRIVDVLPNIPEGIEVIEVGNKILMAGVIDTHVHINEPGRTDWEGFHTATLSALAGGVTTLVDMPLNSTPVTTTVQALMLKIKATSDQLHANCGFWGGIIPSNESDIQPLIDHGVLGFKAFLTHSGIDEFPNVNESDLRKVMPLLSKANLPLLVHCELEEHDEIALDVFVNNEDGNRSYHNYLNSRPRKWEDDAVNLMIRLCEEYNCRVHIVHLSSSGSLAAIKAAKDKTLRLTVETAQHYLYFDAERIRPGKTEYKCAPPIREHENNDQLWDALKKGFIDFVATDHSPCPPALKEMESRDFTKAWGGISSIQFALPALWTAAKSRGCHINDIAKWLCEKPAKLAGLDKQKGFISKGYDADLIVWDDERSLKVTPDIILHKHKVTPYFNETLFGIVEKTFIAGELVFDDGSFVLNQGKIILSNT